LSNVTFRANRVSDISKQLDQLFGTTSTIVITGLTSDSLDPNDETRLIAGNGVTFETGGVIHVAYDIGQCDGDGIFTITPNGSRIPTPNPVILYHELAHALRFANDQHSNDETIEERAAETQENLMRHKLGLPQRDVNSHFGGCGIISPGGVGSANKPVPTVTCSASPKTLRLANHIEINWQANVEYDFYIVMFSEFGGPPTQVDIHSAGRSGSFRISPTSPGAAFSVQVDGCFSHIFDSDCSGFSAPVRITATPNLRSLKEFCRLSGVDPAAGLDAVLAIPGGSSISLRAVLGI